MLLRIIHTRVHEKLPASGLHCLHEYTPAEGHIEKHGSGLGSGTGNSREIRPTESK